MAISAMLKQYDGVRSKCECSEKWAPSRIYWFVCCLLTIMPLAHFWYYRERVLNRKVLPRCQDHGAWLWFPIQAAQFKGSVGDDVRTSWSFIFSFLFFRAQILNWLKRFVLWYAGDVCVFLHVKGSLGHTMEVVFCDFMVERWKLWPK